MIKLFHKSLLLIGVIALGFSFEAKSQNTEKSPPLSFSPYFEKVIAKSQLLETTTVPPLDMKKVEQDALKGIGIEHFAKHLQVDFTLENSGEWRELPNGDRIWRLKVHSAGAFSLQPFFGEFNIPQGAKFYVYDNMNRVYGAFNEESNRKTGDFIVPFVDGNFVTLEYFEPSNQRGKGKIKMTELSYGYKNVFAKKEHGFENETNREKVNESNACNININCPDGADWQVHKRAVAGIVMRFGGGSAVCSGSLINNTNLDKTPYFITAWHCWGADNSAQWANWQFRFNYEALGCENPITAPVPTTLTGCALLEQNVSSDYMLLQLNADATQVSSVNPYFVGWDNRPNIPTQVAGIHHPAGDIKKYSEKVGGPAITTNPNPNTFGGGTVPLDIPAQALFQFQWTKGWMEGGSSGSALFDQNKRLVGTLTGGTSGVANCNNSIRTNSYGRFSKHWENNAVIKQKLSPTNASLQFLEGLDPNNTIANNTGITSISSTVDGCAYSVNTPIRVTIRNFGTVSQNNIPVNWKVRNLSTNLEQTGSFNITTSLASVSATNQTFNADLSSPGVSYLITVRTTLSGDGNTANDELQGTLTNRTPTIHASGITFSNRTSESMTISFTQGNARNRIVVMKKDSPLTASNYPINGASYTPNEQFEIGSDIGGNAFVMYQGQGNQVNVRNLPVNSTYYVGVFEYDCNPILYLTSGVIPTASEQTLSLEDRQLDFNLKIYPNPSSDFIQVELNDNRYESAEISFVNILGNSIKKQAINREGDLNINSKISLEGLPKGVYIIHFSAGKSKTYRKIIVN